MDWTHSLAGALVGLMVGTTGVGGGSLMAPILILLLGVAPTTAVGTDLWFAAATKAVGGSVHHKFGQPDWKVVRLLCYGSIPAAAVTIFFLSSFELKQVKDGLIMQALAGILILTAIGMLARGPIQNFALGLKDATRARFKTNQPALTVLAGIFLGTLVTLTSVGAGALGTTILLALYPLRMRAAKLVGTDIVHAVPLTLVAGMGHLWLGHVDFRLLGALLIGSVPGVIIGSLLSTRLPENFLRPIIASVLGLSALKLLGIF
jgi:uncharacterized protein